FPDPVGDTMITRFSPASTVRSNAAITSAWYGRSFMMAPLREAESRSLPIGMQRMVRTGSPGYDLHPERGRGHARARSPKAGPQRLFFRQGLDWRDGRAASIGAGTQSASHWRPHAGSLRTRAVPRSLGDLAQDEAPDCDNDNSPLVRPTTD